MKILKPQNGLLKVFDYSPEMDYEDFAIENNKTNESIIGLSVDSGDGYFASKIEYSISRTKSGDTPFIQQGSFGLIFDGTNWHLVNHQSSGLADVELEVSSGAVGQVQYTSDDKAGYTGIIRFKKTDL